MGHSMLYSVIAFGTNQMRTWNFLLVSDQLQSWSSLAPFQEIWWLKGRKSHCSVISHSSSASRHSIRWSLSNLSMNLTWEIFNSPGTICHWRLRMIAWHGPRNLYGRDGKFRHTFKSGTEKCLFSVPLLMTWCPQNAPNCTDLHLYFQKIFRGNTPDPQNLGGVKHPPQSTLSTLLTSGHRTTFSELPRPL